MTPALDESNTLSRIYRKLCIGEVIEGKAISYWDDQIRKFFWKNESQWQYQNHRDTTYQERASCRGGIGKRAIISRQEPCAAKRSTDKRRNVDLVGGVNTDQIASWLFHGLGLTMRLSDAGMRSRATEPIYLNHRSSPWLTEDAAPAIARTDC
jgi:hypothetical protein